MGWSLPDPFAQQHGERRSLLRRARVGAMAAFRRDAVDLHLGGEARGVIRSFTGDFDVARQSQAPSLRPFLQHRLRVGDGKAVFAELGSPEAVDDVARRSVAA